MYAQLLGLFGIFATTIVPNVSASAASPTITPAALFAVGDNVITYMFNVPDSSDGSNEAAGLVDPFDNNDPMHTNAYTYTLNLTEGASNTMRVDLYKPPPPGSTVPAELSGEPTALIIVSIQLVLHKQY